jgi:hypothetical protein
VMIATIAERLSNNIAIVFDGWTDCGYNPLYWYL